MSAPEFPKGMPFSALNKILLPLASWAFRPSAEADLESIFGPRLNWAAAFKQLAAFRQADFSLIPPVRILSSSDMPGLWGGYSRDTREIYLSADCPQELLSAVLIEEIGHFLDQELCSEETPGEEGARFAAAVLGLPLDAASSDDSLAPLFLQGRELLVEAARKLRGSSKAKSSGKASKSGRKKRGSSKGGALNSSSSPGSAEVGSTSSNPKLQENIIYATQDSVRILQKAPGDRLIGSRGNDTFVVISQDVRIEDPNGGTDTVESSVTFSLAEHSSIENLALSGSANINGTGNLNANFISGNSGNNKLDGGLDFAIDTLRGGAGNDTYVLRDMQDVVFESPNQGSDTIETTINVASLADFKVDNVENLTFIGNGSATLSGNALANVLTGGANADSIFGGVQDTLVGGYGDDVFYIQSSSAVVIEGSGPLDGTDTVSTALSIYSIENFNNVEVLSYTGAVSSKLSGNSGNNTIIGGNLVRNSIDGALGNDYLIGGSTSDSLVGGGGNDTLLVNRWLGSPLGALGASLQSGGGSDTLAGGEGDDWYVVNSQTAYTFQETSGKDTIASTVTYSLAYNANISTNIENLFLLGAANISGTGNSLHNVITGNDGNNQISSGVGNDTVYGGLGGDVVRGENGNDTIYGGGQPQTDLPADASTAIDLAIGGAYQGKIDFRRDTDWLRVSLQEGVTYYFRIIPDFGTNPNSEFSDIAFGFRGNDDEQGFTFTTDQQYFGLVGDKLWLYSHTELVLNANGSKAYGALETGDFQKNPGKTNNIWGFSFTAFNTGEFYVPISGSGPATGSYTAFLSEDKSLLTIDKSILFSEARPSVLADDAANTLMGGLGNDYLVAGGGRDSLGNIFGEILLGGTNGIPGSVDQDTLSGQDTLIGAGGADVLDGGKGADSMIGGAGSDTYYVDSSSDTIVETDNGGFDDLGIFSLVASAGLDVDLATAYANVEHAIFMGSANLDASGNPDANSLIGNFGNNSLFGLGGDDTLLGQGGNDYLIGGEGGDLLDGGSGVNTMDGGLGFDTYIVNDRNDRVINETAGLDGGLDLVRTFFNFDPIQGIRIDPLTGAYITNDDGGIIYDYQPNFPDNSPSITKSQSFASLDLESFYNLENFELLGEAAYGVGNALANSMVAGQSAALLLGMGGEDTILGGNAGDTLYGDTPAFYASPDIYAPAPKDTQTQAFLDGVIGVGGSDYLNGGEGNNYLDGGRGFDTMIGGFGNDTFVQDNVDDYIVAGGRIGIDELITSVNINQAPDGISKLMLVVAKQADDSGQAEVASFASFIGTNDGNKGSEAFKTGNVSLSVTNANTLELMYAPREGQVFENEELIVGDQEDDLKNPGKFQYDLSWTAGVNAGTDVVGYVVKYKRLTTDGTTPFADANGNGDIWHTYVNGKSQDFQGSRANPTLTVTNLDDGTYDFQVTAIERTIPALQDRSAAQHVTLQGGAGNDAVFGTRITRGLAGAQGFDLVKEWGDFFTDPLLQNFRSPLGFIFNPSPYEPQVRMPSRFASYLDGGFGNDLLVGDFVNDLSGDDYVFQGVTFKGLNTLVGGQGSDTFVVTNGGNAIGDEFDWVVKYGNETPVVTQANNVGSSLNGGQHNLIVSAVDYLTLSDTLVHQGRFIDQLALAGAKQFGMGNRLDNYIYDGSPALSNTLVGNTGRDSIVGKSGGGFLIGGTAYGLDQVGLAVRDFAAVSDGGNGLTNSIFRDTDPVPVSPNGPGTADPSQFWFVPGYYGAVYDPNRNRDTLIANSPSKLDGGAGKDSLVGSQKTEDSSGSDMFYVSAGLGGTDSHDILLGDAVFGNTGNDTVTFTDSDYLWWSGQLEGAVLLENSYSIERGKADGASDISNLILQDGAATSRKAIGNDDSTGNIDNSESEQGSNWIVGNEFDNTLDGGGVGGFLRLGVGIDTLKGGSGNDVFLVQGYTGSDANKWSPSYEYNETKDLTTWDSLGSVYSDGDYVKILDFEAGDNLVLSGLASDYWIGAPATILPTDKLPNNTTPLGYLQKPTSTYFGIYTAGTAGTPNLVAVVSLVGGLSLDTLTLQEAFTPVAGNRISGDIADAKDAKLGWGRFWKLDGSSFAQYVNAAYVSNPSIASLSTLVRSGDDTFIGGVLADFYNGYGGNDSLLGGAGNDTFLGGSANDSLFGEAGADSLLGEAGADYLDGGTDADYLDGGAGSDIYIVDNTADNVFENDFATLTGGVDLILSSIDFQLGVRSINVENLRIIGTATLGAGDPFNNLITGNDQNNSLFGGIGQDTLEGKGTLVGGTDTLNGGFDDDFYIVDSALDQIIEDGAGTDTVLTSVSFDLSNALVNGGTGLEKLIYSGISNAVALTGNASANTIIGGAGSDTLDGKAGVNSLIGGEGNDSLLGGADADTLLGGDGADTLNGGAGTDSLVGGAGNDYYIVDATTDVVNDSAGTDSVLAQVTGYTLGTGVDWLILDTTFASGTGNSLANTLLGNSVNNSLNGGDGNDLLQGTSAISVGANQIDTLTGSGGSDTFVLGDTSNLYYSTAANGADYALITDFLAGTDKFQLNAGVNYVIGNALYGAVGAANCYLYHDADSDSIADSGENLIAAIIATGGSGIGGALVQGDLTANRILV